MPVTVVGRDRLLLPDRLADCERFEPATRAFPLQCHSGRELGQTWRGLPVADLVAAVDMPPETTHLLVVGDGDYRMCVGVPDALDAMLAYECDGEPVGDEAGTTRIVGPGIDSTHSVKAVTRIEGVALDCDTEPRELETHDQVGETDRE